MKNKNPNWKKKSEKYFYPKAFKKTMAIKHGIKNEPLARKACETEMGVKVIQLGLVLPRENSWLGYSPDGVTLDENGRLNKLILY